MIPARRRRLDVCAVAILALSVTSVGVIWGTRVAAGSDAYGYVSQVDLWLRGDLHIDQSFDARVPWPLARWTFLPLGYRPEPDGYRIVPQYPYSGAGRMVYKPGDSAGAEGRSEIALAMTPERCQRIEELL